MKAKRILAALDLSSIDQSLISYAGYWARISKAEKLYFLHVAPSLEDVIKYMPEYQELSDDDAPIDEQIKERVEAEIKEHLPDVGDTEVIIEVIEGKPLPKLLEMIRVKKVDFVAVGHKPLDQGSGVFSRNVLRQVQDGYVLVVPPNMPHKLSRIAVPVDFSHDSAIALKTASELAELSDNCPISLMNIYDVPNFNYGRIGRTRDEMVKMVEGNVAEALDKFKTEQIPNFKGAVKYSALPSREYSAGEHICRYAIDETADMIIMGAHGHSRLERFFLGSVTEKVLLFNHRIPMLIAKDTADGN